ncbi:MAG: septation protein SpoVG family protein [Bacteroidota bacterium]
MQILEMQPANTGTAIKAFFKLETDEGIVIDGFKVVEGKNGTFVGVPSKKVGEKYIDTVTIPRPLKETLLRLALEKFGTLGSGGRPEPPESAPPFPPDDNGPLPF